MTSTEVSTPGSASPLELLAFEEQDAGIPRVAHEQVRHGPEVADLLDGDRPAPIASSERRYSTVSAGGEKRGRRSGSRGGSVRRRGLRAGWSWRAPRSAPGAIPIGHRTPLRVRRTVGLVNGGPPLLADPAPTWQRSATRWDSKQPEQSSGNQSADRSPIRTGMTWPTVGTDDA